jgi:hypothetical protein
MSSEASWNEVVAFVENYIEMVRVELAERWENWSLDLVRREMYEVIGALLARQVTLATQFARAPSMWNEHIAPLILRTMTDTYITLAWIFCDPEDRTQKFILHGLGQQKLHMEHLKANLEAQGDDAEENPLIQAIEVWINSQQYTFLTEVNLGSWSGIDTRKMAQEAGCIDLYNYAYAPFSAATHSMWHHISRFNLMRCPNPLHGYHKVPIDPQFSGIDPDYLYRAAKYVDKSFRLFDEKTSVKITAPSAFQTLIEALQQFYGDDEENGEIEAVPDAQTEN